MRTIFQLPSFKIPAQPGIVFDTASGSGYQAALSSYSFSHVIGSGLSDRCLIVGVSLFATGSVSSVTYNSVAMSFVRGDTNGIYRSEIWRLVAPSIGSNSVAVTLSGSLTSIANAQSYSGVDQASPIDANNGSNGTSTPAAASVTTVIAKDRVVGVLATKTASGVTSQAGQSPRTSASGALGTGASADKGLVDSPASTTLTWNGITALDNWAVSLAALTPVQAVAVTTYLKDVIRGCGGIIPWKR